MRKVAKNVMFDQKDIDRIIKIVESRRLQGIEANFSVVLREALKRGLFQMEVNSIGNQI